MARKAKTVTRVPVTPEGLEMVCKELWGETWRKQFEVVTGISYSQLHRYMTFYKGQVIPKIVILALVAMRDLQDAKRPMPDVSPFEDDIANVKPVKHVQQAKPKVERPDNDAPLADWGDFDTAPENAPEVKTIAETPAPEPIAETPAPEPIAETPAPEPIAETPAPVKKPAKAKAAPKPKAPPKAKTKPAKPAKAAPIAETAKAKPRRKMAEA